MMLRKTLSAGAAPVMALVMALVMGMSLCGPLAWANREPPAPEATAPAPAPSEAYEQGVQAVDAGDYETALTLFKRVIEAEPDHANAYNMLGYTHRRLQDYKAAIRNYRQALAIDPEHTGAHHYIGEAYLEIGNLAMAEKHLQRLNIICLFGCDDFEDLQQAVELYRHNNGPTQPTG